jgi:replicative DNA helicase
VHYSAEAELSVLGAMLIDVDAVKIAGEQLEEWMFYRPGNRKAFAAMLAIDARGDVVDALTLATELRNRGALEEAGGMQFIASIMDAVPTSVGLEQHAKIVVDHAALRKLAGACSAAVDLIASAAGRSPEEVHGDVERLIADAEVRTEAAALVPVRVLLGPMLDEMETWGTPAEVKGVRTGLADVDARTGGFMPGELVVVAARPSMGKSAMAVCNIAAHATLTENRTVALFSPETKRRGVVSRILASESRVNLKEAKARGGALDDEMARIGTAFGYVHSMPLHVDDTSGITAATLARRLHRLRRESPEGQAPEVVIVDYLQKMRDPAAKGDTRREVANNIQALKDIGMEFNVVMIALSQLSRQVEQRPDKRPMMSDLREAGEIEQEADTIMFLYRPEYYFGDTDKEGNSLVGLAEVIIGKARDGWTGPVPVAFEKEFTKFADLSRRQDYR